MEHAKREEAEDRILAAANFFSHLKKPPRPSDVAATLTNLRNSAERLRKAIDNLDYATLSALETEGLFDHPLIRRMEEHTEPRLEFERLNRFPESSVLLTLLAAIEDAANRGLASMEDANEVDPGGPPQKAGESAMDELAGHCLEIFDHYHPGEATGGVGSNLSIFVETVYEIATGEQASIVRPIKRACRM